MTKARTLADNFAADINGITAGTGITGGGTSGTVTITNDMATTIAAKGDLVAGTANDAYAALTVGTDTHLLMADSTTGTGLKWALDPTQDLVTTKGDIVAATAADTLARLGVGANNTVLTADSTTATGLKWVAPSSGALTLITQASFDNPNISVSNCFSTTYENYLILIEANVTGSTSGRPSFWRWLDSGGNELTGNDYAGINFGYGPMTITTLRQVDSNFVAQYNLPDISWSTDFNTYFVLNVIRPVSGKSPTITGTCFSPVDINQRNFVLGHFYFGSTLVYGFKFYQGTYNLQGNYRVYGYQKS